MRLVVLCATQRGLRFLHTLARLLPSCECTVFSFPEEPWEPPFLEEMVRFSREHAWQFVQTRHVESPQLFALRDSKPVDIMFLVNWRYVIPRDVYQRARLGAFVFHDSLLPKYRGFSPTVWAMINGEDSTGVTLFEIGDELDAGDIVDQERVAIGPNETITTVIDRVTDSYLALLERNLTGLLTGTAPRVPQNQALATFCCRRLPEDNLIDWSADTKKIFNVIRAVTRPYCGAYTYLFGKRVRIWGAEAVPDYHSYVGRVPGRVVEVRSGTGTVVLTGDGALLLTEVQLEGKPSTGAADLLSSTRLSLASQP